MNTVIDLSW